MHDTASPTARETREDFLQRSKRRNEAVPLRRTLVQQGTQRQPVPGPLAELVRRHAVVDLDLYMLAVARAVAPVPTEAHGGTDHSVVVHSRVWSRLLGGVSTSTTSRSLARLEREHQLVRRARSGQKVDVVVLQEDGSGHAYSRPTGGDDPYLQLPYAYWLDGPDGAAWCDVLSMPAKAMLLVGLSLTPPFLLPVDKAPKWYGISGDTAQRGLSELSQHGLLESTYQTKKTPAATANGWTREYRHTLRAPFNARTGRRQRLREVS